MPNELKNLTDIDFALLKRKYRYTLTYNFHGPAAIALQHVFKHYGIIPSNKPLQYALLAYSVPGSWNLPGDCEAWTLRYKYISLYRKSMIKAIDDGKLSECDLFALVLVHWLRPNKSDYTGFDALLWHLIETKPKSQNANPSRPLAYMYQYLLINIRSSISSLSNHLSETLAFKYLQGLRALAPYLQDRYQIPDIRISSAYPQEFGQIGELNNFCGLHNAMKDISADLNQLYIQTFSSELLKTDTPSMTSSQLLRMIEIRFREILELPVIRNSLNLVLFIRQR